MKDKTFWESFNNLAKEVEKGKTVSKPNRKSILFIRIKKSKRENETGHFAVGNYHYYEDYDVLGEYVLKQNEVLPSFFDEISPDETSQSLLRRINIIADYNLKRSVNSYKKYLTLKNIEAWMENGVKK